MKRLTVAGFVLTALIVAIVCIYLYFNYDITQLQKMKPAEFSNFLAGFASTLALLWLVLGFIQQRIDMESTTRVLNEQAQHLERQAKDTANQAENLAFQAESLKLSESHTRRDVILKIYEFTSEHLIVIADKIVKKLISENDYQDAKDRYFNGQKSAFFRSFGDYFARTAPRFAKRKEKIKIFAAELDKKNISASILVHFCEKYKIIKQEADNIDDIIMNEIIKGTDLDKMYDIISEVLNESPYKEEVEKWENGKNADPLYAGAAQRPRHR